MDVSQPIRDRGFLTLDHVRNARTTRFEVLVDVGACIRGGDMQWRPLKRLGSPLAKFPVAVSLPGGERGCYRTDEVRGIRQRQRQVADHPDATEAVA